MLLALLIAISPYVDLSVRLDLPIPVCEPTLVGVDGKPLAYPPASPLVFNFGETPVRVVIASTCQYPRWICLNYQIFCDSDCVYADVGRDAPKDETDEDRLPSAFFCETFCTFGAVGRTSRFDEVGEDAITFSVPKRCWSQVKQVTCRIEYHASSMADITGDCRTTAWDARRLIESKARNRLRIWAYLQNEWSAAANTQAEWDRERVAPDPDPDGIEQGP